MKSSCYSLAVLLGALASGLLVLGFGAGGSTNRVERSLAPRVALARHARTSRLIARVPRGPVPARGADRLTLQENQPVGGLEVIAAWGPLGVFPYDAEAHGDLRSVSSDAAVQQRDPALQFVHAEIFESPAETHVADEGEQAWRDLEATLQESLGGADERSHEAPVDTVAAAVSSLVADTTADLPTAGELGEPWEPLPFRVLGWDHDECTLETRPEESAFAVLQGTEVLFSEDFAGDCVTGEVPADVVAGVESATRVELLRQVGRSLVAYGRWLEELAAQSERVPAPCQ